MAKRKSTSLAHCFVLQASAILLPLFYIFHLVNVIVWVSSIHAFIFIFAIYILIFAKIIGLISINLGVTSYIPVNLDVNSYIPSIFFSSGKKLLPPFYMLEQILVWLQILLQISLEDVLLLT